MSKRLAATVVFGALTASSAAFSQGVTFEAVDGDQDGFLTFSEISAAVPAVTEDVFKAADSNQDAVLSPDEFTALGL
ncbi:hypothetical protein [Roseibium polysiphoniae]|nr:hypothetical protein [Roseibium polysiphoniae]MBD8877577.1 hypothetical protein [Roseibium polysiphoniae]